MSNDIVLRKQPIRKLEIPINKFNDVAIPHHLDLLRQHKENVKKYQNMKDWRKVQREQINASRLVKQLEQLLHEMDTLRAQVDNNDIEKFDKLTFQSRNSTIHAIQEYLELKLEVSLPINESGSSFDDDINKLKMDNLHDEKFIQLQQEQDDIDRQEACLQAWNLLQKDLHQLHQLFIDFNKLINDQKHQVDVIENDVIESNENVQAGTKYLEQASKLKVAMYPVAGALIGTCIGGPIGLIAGIKLGGLTAFGGGILGFTGAKILKKKFLDNLNRTEENKICTDVELREKSKVINDNLLIAESKKKS